MNKHINEIKIKEVDPSIMRSHFNKIRKFMNKNNAEDIFIRHDKYLGSIDHFKRLNIKQQKLTLKTIQSKINIMLGFKLVPPYYLLMLLIEKIEMAKKTFTVDI